MSVTVLRVRPIKCTTGRKIRHHTRTAELFSPNKWSHFEFYFWPSPNYFTFKWQHLPRTWCWNRTTCTWCTQSARPTWQSPCPYLHPFQPFLHSLHLHLFLFDVVFFCCPPESFLIPKCPGGVHALRTDRRPSRLSAKVELKPRPPYRRYLHGRVISVRGDKGHSTCRCSRLT